jgi:hypothetical protein
MGGEEGDEFMEVSAATPVNSISYLIWGYDLFEEKPHNETKVIYTMWLPILGRFY